MLSLIEITNMAQGLLGLGPMAKADFFLEKLQSKRAILAPMAGFTDAPFRKLCRDYGSAWAVTEMVSAKALVLGNQQGIDIGEPYPGEPDLVIQLFGAEPDLTAEAAHLLEQSYAPVAFDLNMGCPVKKIINKGCGAQLMRDPAKAQTIVHSLVKGARVPISVKMRLGFDQVNALEVARAVAEAGASVIAIHGRTAKQKYTGEADWDAITEVAEATDIPVIGSGDITSKAQVMRYQARGLGVMIARASLGRPWIFAEVQGKTPPSTKERVNTIFQHAVYHQRWYGSKTLRSLRGQLIAYAKQLELSALRQALSRVETLSELAGLLERHTGIAPRSFDTTFARAA